MPMIMNETQEEVNNTNSETVIKIYNHKSYISVVSQNSVACHTCDDKIWLLKEALDGFSWPF